MPQKSLLETYRPIISVKVLAMIEAVKSTTWEELAMQAKLAEEIGLECPYSLYICPYSLECP